MKKSRFSLVRNDAAMDALVSQTDHQTLAVWAKACAGRVLHYFEDQYPNDRRPQQALDTLQAWIDTGVFRMAVIRKASLDSHAAAREVGEDNPARSAARAAGQAVATAHVITHAPGAAIYAQQAIHRRDLGRQLVKREGEVGVEVHHQSLALLAARGADRAEGARDDGFKLVHIAGPRVGAKQEQGFWIPRPHAFAPRLRPRLGSFLDESLDAPRSFPKRRESKGDSGEGFGASRIKSREDVQLAFVSGSRNETDPRSTESIGSAILNPVLHVALHGNRQLIEVFEPNRLTSSIAGRLGGADFFKEFPGRADVLCADVDESRPGAA